MAFKEGDIVIAIRGKLPARVVYADSYIVQVLYLSSNKTARFYPNELKLYTIDEETTTMTQDNILYSFTKEDGTVAYGKYLATNSAQMWVVEELPGGTIHTLPKEKFTEVVPFTFAAKCGNSTHHFTCDENKVKKGDILFKDGNLYQVTELNTKKRDAGKFNGVRLTTEPF